MWLTQRILREQGTIRMPQSARLLIEFVYGEHVNMPVGFAKPSNAGRQILLRLLLAADVLLNPCAATVLKLKRFFTGENVNAAGGRVCHAVAGETWMASFPLCQR